MKKWIVKVGVFLLKVLIMATLIDTLFVMTHDLVALFIDLPSWSDEAALILIGSFILFVFIKYNLIIEITIKGKRILKFRGKC